MFHTLWMVVVLAAAAAAEKPASEKPGPKQDLPAQTLALRTALHYDPLLDAPLEKLLATYREAQKQDELLGLYRTHISQFPGDANSTIVLLRLLAACNDPEAPRMAAVAVEKFPKIAGLHFVYYTILAKQHDAKALDELDAAILLETQAGRKGSWIEVLLRAATQQDRRDLAKKHLLAMVPQANTAELRLDLARKMNKFSFHAPALELTKKTDSAAPSPETMVALELEAATAEVGLDHGGAAAARLDRLLGKLAADYWQRAEIVRRRLALIHSQVERETMVENARQQVKNRPQDEAAAIDLAQVLLGLDSRREALAVLLEAGRRLPKSAAIEKHTLEILSELRDEHGLEQYLAQRIKENPDRKDLVWQHVRTLYIRGRKAEAQAELTTALEGLPPGDQVTQLLETARALRRLSQPAEAAELLTRVVKLEPTRLDVRRELAETLLATGNKQKPREVLADVDPCRAELENVLDLVPFMIQQEMLPEAKTLVRKRLEIEKENLDLRLLLLDIHRRLGDAAGGETLLVEARALADTTARYRLWLEAAAAFHQEFDTLAGFLEGEQARLDGEPAEWTLRKVERRLAFAETAGRGDRRAQVAAMLKKDLASNPPRDVRIRFRRQLLAILETSPTAAEDFPQEIAELAKDDPQLKEECQARLALWHLKGQRPDMARTLVWQLDLAKIQDPVLLGGLRSLYLQMGGEPRTILALLERITALNPTDRSAWTQWLTALAIHRDDVKLSLAIRRLLAGVDKMPLSEETRKLLQAHLVDAQWRLVARRLADGNDASLADALPLLSAIERTVRDDTQWLWVAWVRAYVFNRLGRLPARDETIKEIERVLVKIQPPEAKPSPGLPDVKNAAQPPDEKPSTGPRPLMLALPDGLTISLARARAMLSAPAPAAARRPVEDKQQGPLSGLKVKWAFDVPRGTVALVLPLPPGRVLVGDRQGTLYCLDKATGKLLWQRGDAIRPIAGAPSGDDNDPFSNPVVRSLVMPEPLADGAGRFFVPGAATVSCYSGEDGRLLWEAHVAAVGAEGKQAPPCVARPTLILERGRLLVWEPGSGAITRLDPATGKVLWERILPAGQPAAGPVINAGASLSGRRLLVYGSRTAVVDADTGEVEWSFEPWRVRKFPIPLLESDPSPAQVAASPPGSAAAWLAAVPAYGATTYNSYGYGRHRWRHSPWMSSGFYSGGYGSGNPQPLQFMDYSETGDPQNQHSGGLPEGEMCLTGPALVWAAQLHNVPCSAELRDQLLVLVGPGGVHGIRLDLPLAGQRMNEQGILLGMAGRVACLCTNNGNQLSLVNVEKNTVHHEAFGHDAIMQAQAVIDGPLVYVTGEDGIKCIRASTGAKIFTMPWPAGALPQAAEKAAKQPDNTALSAPGFVAVPAMVMPAPSSYSPGLSYPLPPAVYPGGSAPVAQLPPLPPTIGRVDQGVLYVPATHSRVVALVEGGDGK